MRKFVLTTILIVVFLAQSPGQEVDYEPYQKDEFPRWAQDLRRFEIVFFGTIPFSFLYTSMGYSLYKYGAHNWDSAYAPAILGNKTPQILMNSEKIQIIYTALGVSFTAAVMDFILGKMSDD